MKYWSKQKCFFVIALSLLKGYVKAATYRMSLHSSSGAVGQMFSVHLL